MRESQHKPTCTTYHSCNSD